MALEHAERVKDAVERERRLGARSPSTAPGGGNVTRVSTLGDAFADAFGKSQR